MEVRDTGRISRELELSQKIHQMFGRRIPSEETMKLYPFPTVVLRYLTISQMHGACAFFRDSYDPKQRFGPVLLPMHLWGLPRRGDTFLVCLGREEDRWELIFLSDLVLKVP